MRNLLFLSVLAVMAVGLLPGAAHAVGFCSLVDEADTPALSTDVLALSRDCGGTPETVAMPLSEVSSLVFTSKGAADLSVDDSGFSTLTGTDAQTVFDDIDTLLAASGFDATSLDAVTWSDGSNASNVWTFDVSGTDTTMTFGSDDIAFSGSVTGETININSDTDQIVFDADGANTGTLRTATLGGARIWTLPNSSGTIGLSTGSTSIDTVGTVTTGVWDAGAVTSSGTVTAPTVALSGTGTLNGLDAIDATGEATLESALDIAGDVTGTGLGAVEITAGAIVNADVNASAAIAATKIHDGSVSNTEYGYLDGVTSSIQTQLGGKQGTLTNEAGLYAALSDVTQFWEAGDTISSGAIDGEIIQNGTIDDDSIDFGDVTLNDLTFDVGSVSKTEYGYLNGVTSSIQTQLAGKQGSNALLTDIAALTDPDADSIVFWDDSAGSIEYLAVGTGLSISGTTLSATGGGGAGDVTGPASATDNAVARFNGASGEAIQNSDMIIADNGKVSVNGAAQLRQFNVYAEGLDARLFFEGPAGSNPGVEFATDSTGDRRTLIRLDETGTSGTSLEFYTRPSAGGSAVNTMLLDHAGDLTVTGDINGRDIATDGSKLDNIEANADVTDEANVTDALDGATLSDIGTPASGDRILIQDASASNVLKYAAFSEFGGGGGGAPTDVNYLVGTASAGLSAEIVVGTTPGGELGGTWASPTIDDNVTVTGWALGTIASGVGTNLTALNGENIQNDTIDDDSIDFGDVTLNDFTFDVGSVSKTEYGYLNGVTSSIQTQLGGKLSNVVEDTTPQLGGDLDANGNDITDVQSIGIDATPDTDHTATGPTTSSIDAGVSISAFQLLYLASDGEFALTNAETPSTTKGMLAIALESGSDNSPINVATSGAYVRDDSWAWGAGSVLYMAPSNGGITDTAPSGVDNIVRVIGYAVSSDVIYFLPSATWIQVVGGGGGGGPM